MKLIASWILVFWLLAISLGYLAGLDPNAVDLNAVLSAPNQRHWFGADDLGRDILARVLHGVKISMLVACVVTMVSLLTGIVVEIGRAHV